MPSDPAYVDGIPAGELEGGGGKVVFRGKTWARRSLAAFLNLLVMPGCGSFVLGRRMDGVIQILMVAAGLILKVGAAVSLVVWVGPLLDEGGIPDSEMIAGILASKAYDSQPPEFVGIEAGHAMVAGLALVVAAWLYGLVSLFLPIGSGRARGTRS